MAEQKKAPVEYEVVNYPEPHPGRAAAILKAHPEVRKLFGRNPATALLVPPLIAVQLGMAYAVSQAPWWGVLLAGFTVSAVCNHALFMVIHEATHSLIFRSRMANMLMVLLSNLTHVIPSGVTFSRFHLVHHRHQGEYDVDADLPSHVEARLLGTTRLGKFAWLLLYPALQSVRMMRFSRSMGFWEPWTVVNLLVQVAFCSAVWWLWGPVAVLYLLLGSIFAFGLHPFGGRWIQEHFVVAHPQETYSYYGPGNWVALNIGYHNEHHDFSAVPWNRLPRVKAAAPEFYDTLVSHRSWTALALRFVFDPSLSLYSHITRPPPALRKLHTSGIHASPEAAAESGSLAA